MSNWKIVSKKQKNTQIQKPCWFYNTGSCKNKDGSLKADEDCKYVHIISPNITRPPHINTMRPCDKFNLDGNCKWGEYCKYSHETLTVEKWNEVYINDYPIVLL